MYKIGTLWIQFVFLMFVTTQALAEMPKELKGFWILEAQATERNILASPKLTPKDAKYLPTVLKRMSQYVWEFNDGVITSSRGTKNKTLTVVLKENNKKEFVFEGQMDNQTIMMTVTFVNNALINIRSSATDDMYYYLWTRGKLDNGMAKDSDSSLAIELMEKSLNNSSVSSDAANGE